MNINTKKTQSMIIANSKITYSIELNVLIVEQVKSFIYLGPINEENDKLNTGKSRKIV